MNALELLYFTDPMCSWCYGFSPVLRELRQRHPDRFSLSLITGGLRPDETRAMPAHMGLEIASHWKHVQEASGRDFDFSFFEKYPGFVYDTSPASRAVVAAWRMRNDCALDYQDELQKLFYARAENPTILQTFERAAAGIELDVEEFRDMYNDKQTEDIVRGNFGLSFELGIRAFPTLCARRDHELFIVTQVYLPYDMLEERLRKVGEQVHSRSRASNEAQSGEAC